MHVKAKTMAFGGLLLALAVVFMTLGSILETSTLFLLAAASYFVGIIVREFRLRIGVAFYIASVLLGFIAAPNKFYVMTFAAMGIYILGREAVWKWLETRIELKNRIAIFWVLKYVIFNIIYIPVVFIFQELLFGQKIAAIVLVSVIAGGQAGLFIYDKAYEYVQTYLWGKIRGRVL